MEKKSLGLGLIIALIAIITSVIILHSRWAYEEKLEEQILASQRFTIHLQALDGLLKEAESSQRGFLLSRDTSYLQPYYVSFRQYKEALKAIESYYYLQPGQQLEIENELKLLVQHRFNEMWASIALAEKGEEDSVQRMINAGLGLSIMDSITHSIEAITFLENAKIVRVLEDFDDEHEVSSLLFYIAMVLVTGILFTTYIQLTRKTKQVNELISEIRQNNTQLEGSNQELQRLHHEKNRFLRIAAHDLKSPLINIISVTKLVREEDKLSKVQESYIDFIYDSASRLNKLIRDLLDVARIESGSYAMEPEPVKLNEFVAHLSLAYRTESQRKSINFSAKLEPEDLTIHTDKTVLFQVIDNLISNAFKFSREGDSVNLIIDSGGDTIRFVIADTGPGISPQEQNRLFGSFQKLSPKPTGGEYSSGLGLSIVKDLVSQLKGNIAVESQSGRGTQLTVELPQNI